MPTTEIEGTKSQAASEVSGLDALELAPRKEKGRFGLRLWRSAWPKLLAIGIVLLAWELAYLSEWKPAYVFPSPAQVFPLLWDLVTTADFWDGVRLTMTR
jgi:NitT/TauT family transport system permease protein